MHQFFLPVLLVSLFAGLTAGAQSTQPDSDAAELYLRAAKMVTANCDKNVQCPSSSSKDWPRKYPPFADDWQEMEEEDFDANIDARDLAHQARLLDRAKWPDLDTGEKYLNDCRSLSNELADAALYQLTQNNHAAAVESVRDLFHLADLLEGQTDKKLICMLVAVGMRAEGVDRLNLVMANSTLTNDPHNLRDVQVSVVRELTHQLLQHDESKKFVDGYVKAEAMPIDAVTAPTIAKLIHTAKRVNTERDLSAMALACDLYRFEQGKWPATDKFLSAYLPFLPIDAWGDGKQTLGYVLVQHALPDGADRPLVYARSDAQDGLYFRTDQPFYNYYTGQEISLGGQFRDVVGWYRKGGMKAVPARQPLPIQ